MLYWYACNEMRCCRKNKRFLKTHWVKKQILWLQFFTKLILNCDSNSIAFLLAWYVWMLSILLSVFSWLSRPRHVLPYLVTFLIAQRFWQAVNHIISSLFKHAMDLWALLLVTLTGVQFKLLACRDSCKTDHLFFPG